MCVMGGLWLVGSIKIQVSFAKEPHKRDDILQKRPTILSILLTVATPYVFAYVCPYAMTGMIECEVVCVCVFAYVLPIMCVMCMRMCLRMCAHIQ